MAAGELADAPVSVSGEVHLRKHIMHGAFDFLLAAVLQAHAECYILIYIQMGKQGILLEDGVDLPLVGRKVRNVFLIKKDIPLIRFDKAGNGAERGGLAAAGRPEQRDEFPVVYVQIETAQNLLPIIGNGNVFQ